MFELFDKKFVYFAWDDELNGKECFVADDMAGLRTQVNHGLDANLHKVENSQRESSPFRIVDNENYTFIFAYYDPNYDVKKAFNNGKRIQFRRTGVCDWVDCDEPFWNEKCCYRIKPEVKNWIAYLARAESDKCYLTCCEESNWKEAQKEYGAKTKLFIGAYDKVIKWYKDHEKFTQVIKAWEDGKKIQFKSLGFWLPANPTWDIDIEYRVEPEKEKRWIVYLARPKNRDWDCYLDACIEDNWELVQKECGAKTKLFIGAKKDAQQWCESKREFTGIIKAWEDDKPVEFCSHLFGEWIDLNPNTAYFDGNISDYRVKPSLKWTDLKIGDVLSRCYDDGDHVILAVNGINVSDSNQHILLGNKWISDEELENWKKE